MRVTDRPRRMSSDQRHLFLCDAERESALADELRVAGDGAQIEASEAGGGALWLDSNCFASDGPPLTLAFARQTLPAARLLSGQSVTQIARETTQAAIESCDALESWSLHVLRGTGPDAPGPNRIRVLLTEIESNLKKRRRRLLRTLRNQRPDSGPVDSNGDDPTRVFGESTSEAPQSIVQLFLESRERAWLSVYVPERDSAFRRCVSPFPGGEWSAPEDRRPPSRAYRKLAEALVQFPWLRTADASKLTIQAGDRCVDLGASPGGWSWLALERGASVVAVDRSPLREDLMQHPGLSFVQGDAFRFQPAAKSGARVDWLICDVIAFPDRILELLREWLERRRCRKFCVTVKFRGVEDYAALNQIKNMLNECAFDFAIRRLCENKNEATIFGTL